jgi:hypothetical protein
MSSEAPIELSKHAKEMLVERNISEEWVWRTIQSFDNKSVGVDANLHFTKAIVEKENRILHVVVNPQLNPNRVVTLFFDRRLRSKK